MKWKIIEGFENYEVSNNGIVRNVKTGKLLNPYSRKGSDLKEVGLYDSIHKNRRISVFRLVALHFVPNPNNFKNVIPKNKKWDDARAENMVWVDGETWLCFCGLNKTNSDRPKKSIEESLKIINGKLDEIFWIKKYYETNDIMILHDLFNSKKGLVISKLRSYSQRKSFIEEGVSWVRLKFFDNCKSGSYAGTNLGYWLQRYAQYYCEKIEKIWNLKELDSNYADLQITETQKILKYA